MAQMYPEEEGAEAVQQPSLGLRPGLPSDQIPGFGILQQFGFIKCSRTSEWRGPAKLGPVPLENH